jgi:hypothetical protein
MKTSMPMTPSAMILLLILSACDSKPPAAVETEPAQPTKRAHTADEQLHQAAARSAARMANFDLSKADFSPIGQADCDAFLLFAKQCFSSATMPGTETLLPATFEHINMLRRMAGQKPQPSILNTLCQQQVDSQEQLKAAFGC